MPTRNAIPSPAFNPAFAGTPDARWNAALEEAPALTLPLGPIVIVSPHPDDEVFGAGGLMAAACGEGTEVTVVSVTDGEAAYPDWHGLHAIRRRELSDALAVLGCGPTASRPLRLPDGDVSAHRGRLFEAIDRLVFPGTLLVAPYEHDGHPDHDATGEVCREIARQRGVALWRFPIWAWHHSVPERFAGGEWRRFTLDAPIRATKAQAVTCFASQLRPKGRAPIVPDHVLGYFRRPYEAFLV